MPSTWRYLFKLSFELLVLVFDGIENLKSIILDKITCDGMWPWTVTLEWLLKISVVISEWLFAVSQRTFNNQSVYFEIRSYVDDVRFYAVKWQLNRNFSTNNIPDARPELVVWMGWIGTIFVYWWQHDSSKILWNWTSVTLMMTINLQRHYKAMRTTCKKKH